MELWRIGYKLMEGTFLRLIGRIKHTGIVVSNASPKSYYDPVDAKNNFIVPSIVVILRSNESLQPILPGLIIPVLDKITNGCKNFKSFILEIDYEKICRGKGIPIRDINMWEFEAKTTLKEKQDQLQTDLTLLAETEENACSILT